MAHPIHSVADEEIDLLQIVAMAFGLLILLGALLLGTVSRTNPPAIEVPPVATPSSPVTPAPGPDRL